MRRIAVVLVVFVIAGGWLYGRRDQAEGARAAGATATDADGRARVVRSRYQLAYEQVVVMDGREPIRTAVRGTWTTVPVRGGRTEVRLAAATLDGPDGTLPTAAEAAGPVQVTHVDGVLAAMGFSAAMPARGRALVTTVATTMQLSARAGAGWTVVEDDVLGRYPAIYTRTGDAIVRTRTGYTALRGPDGLSPQDADDVTATETSRFTVDADGLVTADVAIDLRIALGEDGPAVAVQIRGSLVRTSVEPAPLMPAPLVAMGPISNHADYRAAARDADARVVAGATTAELLAELARVAQRTGNGQERAHALTRLATAIRLEPALAAEVAATLRAHAAALTEAELLAGALASARVPEATDALAELVTGALPAPAQTAVMNALSLSEPVTATSLAALTASLDGPDGRQAAMALGGHRLHAGADLASPAADATAELLRRYARASSAERLIYVQALGNTGDAAALPVLAALATGADDDLACAALYSLRFIPGAEVDAILAAALDREAHATAAARAIGWRDPARGRAPLEAALLRFPDHNGVQTTIRAIFRRWQ